MFFDYKALDQELRKHLPCVFDIAVFCMSIYQWIVSPKQPKTSGWLFGLCFFLFCFVFNRCIQFFNTCTCAFLLHQCTELFLPVCC